MYLPLANGAGTIGVKLTRAASQIPQGSLAIFVERFVFVRPNELLRDNLDRRGEDLQLDQPYAVVESLKEVSGGGHG